MFALGWVFILWDRRKLYFLISLDINVVKIEILIWIDDGV